MRTVILNTLDSGLRQTSLFYLPFREEQFQWEDIPLSRIGDAVEKISSNSSHQGQIQDYHLVVLVSLSRYHLCRHKRLREVCQKLLQAHINHALVLPLAEEKDLPPAEVSIVYVTPNCSDGDGSVTEGKELDTLLGVAEQDEITSLVLTTDDGEQLDMTDYFGLALADYASKRPEERKKLVAARENRSLKVMRADLKGLLETMCKCRYFAPGEDQMRTIEVHIVDFFPLTNNWDLFSIDLLINLSDHLAAVMAGADWRLNLKPHDEKEIQKRIALALRRVRRLLDAECSVTYYPMEPYADALDVEDLPGSIWQKLQDRAGVTENGGLPGVDDLKEIMGDTYDSEAVDKESDEKKTGDKPPHVWLWLGLAKKKFEKEYRTFTEQFNPDTAQTQQMIVLDTCTETFQDWRTRMLRREAAGFGDATLAEMPDYDLRAAREELEKAQREYGEVYVERLEDYEDLRKEAEEVKAKFRKDTRLWSKEGVSSTGWFLLYSGVLAILFLLQMILPFVGITVKTASAQLSGYIHLGISIAVFASLYAVGVILWLRALCARVNKNTLAMYTLVERSQQRRLQSIVDAVETYGRRLPACLIKYENLKRLERIYAANLLRKNHYHTHVQILDKAEEVLMELHTQLRLPKDIDVGADEQLQGTIDYQCTPNDPVNVPYYNFLAEKWGGG